MHVIDYDSQKNYIVAPISEGVPGINALSVSCAEKHRYSIYHDTYSAAKKTAEDMAWDYYWGTAVVDTSRKIIDWGDEWTDFEGKDIDSPDYV